MLTMAGTAVFRALKLCMLLDRAHTAEELHQAMRAVRHELETAQDLLHRVNADLPAPREGLARSDAPETSRAAARAIRTRSGSQRHEILRYIASTLPPADFQMQNALRMGGNSQRPRRVELLRAGYIRPLLDDTGVPVTVKNPESGLACERWEITMLGRSALAQLESGQTVLFEIEEGS